jgi:L-asparagine transporter-like permease
MEPSALIVRLIGAVLASLASAVFVYVYNTIEMHHARLQNLMNSLPNLTNFYAWASPYGFIVPLLVLVIGILCINIRKAAIVNLTLSCFGWLFSLIWSLGCILAWKLPYYIPVIELM